MSIIIPYSKQFIDNKDIQEVIKVLKGKWLTQGPAIANFEKDIVNYTGAKYAVAVSSCTAGLHLACIALGVKKNNNIITSPITFVSSANSAIFCGAEVIISDIENTTGCMSASLLEKTINNFDNVKAVMPIHFAGKTADMKKISNICKKNRLNIIEDCAHALGSTYPSGEKVGSCKYSDISVFSLHAVKSITAGEGGVITTNNKDIYNSLLKLRSHGINKSNKLLNKKNAYTGKLKNPWYYEMQELGYHYRITDIQCALASSQLKKIDKFIKKRQMLALRYNGAFKLEKNIKILESNGDQLSSNHLYILKFNFVNIGISRAALQNKLSSLGIGTQVHYIPLQIHPYLSDKLKNIDSCNVSISFYNNILSIPLYYDLSFKNQDKVIKSIKEIIN